MIPKKMSHIWIGPYRAPIKYMDTWTHCHPKWEYQVYDNDYLSNKKWVLQRQINEYMKRGFYSGVSDLMRYQILYETGGFIPEADAICLNPTDDLFTRRTAYTVYENEIRCGKLVSPILACEPHNSLVGKIIEAIEGIEPEAMREAWVTTGNLLVAYMVDKFPESCVIFPSYYLIPRHFDGIEYVGDGPVYAEQLFGTGTNSYDKKIPGYWQSNKVKIQQKYKKRYATNAMVFARKNHSLPWLHWGDHGWGPKNCMGLS